MGFTIRLKKESFKFSGSHFTIFGPNKGERLHGHNYYVSVSLRVSSISKDLGMAFDFNTVKPLVKEICDSLDEVVLLPENSPYLDLKKQDSEIEVKFNKKRYVFPISDICLLPVANVTSEELARYFAVELAKKSKSLKQITDIIVTVKETQGQEVIYRLKI